MTVQKKILIVDNGKENVAFFDIILTRYGYKIYCAETEQFGLELIKSESPDLVLLDGSLTALSGWEFLKRLKNDEEFRTWKDIPVIVFSVSANVQTKYEVIQLGALDCITKPFSFEDILMRLCIFFEKQDKQRSSAIPEQMLKTLLYGLLTDIDAIVDSSSVCSSDDLKKLKDKYAEKLLEIDFSDIKLLENDEKKTYNLE